MANKTKTKTLKGLGIDLPPGDYGRSEEWAQQFAQKILPGLDLKDWGISKFAARCGYQAGIAVVTAALRVGVEAGERAYQATFAEAKEGCYAEIHDLFLPAHAAFEDEGDKQRVRDAAACAVAAEAVKILESDMGSKPS
jgi:hypothetical protein